MKLTADTKALTSALTLASRAAGRNSPRAIYQCVCLDASPQHGLTVRAGDSEIGVRIELQAVEVHEPGESVVNADKLLNIAKSMDTPTFDLRSEQDVLHVTAPGSKFKVFGHPASDFPATEELGGGSYTIEGARLGAMLKRVMVCMASENSRYSISGVLFERLKDKLTMAATDGHRLSMDRDSVVGDQNDGGSVVPKRAVIVLAGMVGDAEQVTVRTDDNRISFDFDGICMTTALVEGNFPPYEDVIPKNCDKTATVDVEALSSALRRAALLTNEESKGVRLAFEDGGLTMSSRAPDLGEASISVNLGSYRGDGMEIGFNPAYVLDGLSTLEGTVELDLKNAKSPAVIRSGNGKYVVMPVALK